MNQVKPVILVLLLFCVAAAANSQPGLIENPGVRTFIEATKLYQKERYAAAREKYLESARWGNKLSQFNIGTMYYNGTGVARDLPRAWAWIRLSAEREYPQLAAMEREVRAEMNETSRRIGERILENELLPQYGDAVALPQVRRYMDRRYRSATGSRLGGTSGSNSVLVQPRDDIQSIGDVYYSKDVWQVDRWLESERAWFEQMMEAGEPLTGFEEIPPQR